MRIVPILLVGSLLAACSTAPQPLRSAKAEQRYQALLAGKAAGAPQSCLPSYRSNDMVVIDDNTVLFREGSNRTWVNRLQGGCSNLGSGHYALVTRTYGGAGLCRGDIAQVADVQNGITVGSCVLGDFVPYTRVRG